MAISDGEWSIATGCQLAPFQCKMVPCWPTAQTSLGAAPQTRVSWLVVPLSTRLHLMPSQCTMAPPKPTAQTSLGPVPDTLSSHCVVGLATGFQACDPPATQ